MKLSTKQINSINYTASGVIEKASIDEKIKEIAVKASKNIEIKGFRKGKVPLNVVLDRYKDSLTKDSEQELIGIAYKEAIKEIGKDEKDLIGEPVFKKFNRNDNGIEVEFLISFRPTINLDGYEKLIPEVKVEEIKDKDLKARKEAMLKQYAPLEKTKKQILKKGDYAKFDFEGFLDGVAFEGGKANDYMLEIGSNQFIPGFEDSMIDMKVGEEKDINVTFPENYQAANLAGKEVVFKIKLHEIHGKKIPEINEELLKKLLPNEEKVSEELLDEKIKEQMQNEAKFKLIDEKLKIEFVDKMLEKYDFELPQNILEQETNLQLNQAARTFTKEQLEELKDDKKLEEKRKEFEVEAAKSVKLTFIVDELARLRNVIVNDQEVAQAIYFEAMRYGVEPKKLMENYQQNGTIPAIRMSLLEEKLFADIFLGKDK
ncbi:trigger factor [Campylobacter canadensis]|uniref:Trigger factor n=1 Tax=Campylobacter canadensis TaxID=449520 RepID=A0ABS7WUQ6_9BACT|nr:trigger factor [Campylobacter canadensis]MBZ7988116.1 trigger factor [Campylobacter canadensis]MBZ7997385.1 trigger factor [Campylobacter canadensis]MBZ7999091.1 trigger factor [Campylobacter canadensis]MBZ8000862.1 trigger factor [Campylobacter canadensis]MBZ8002614.1 trigger factor [Campylobacter canadensis]